MAIDREQVLQLLDSEEPDYRAAALAASGDSWDTLEAMVKDADASIAARAASLVATLAQNPALASQAVPAIDKAAGHADASVRAVAAFAASRAGKPANDIVTTLLKDDDSGVRRLAFRGQAPPLAPSLAQAVQDLAADVAAGVRDAAVALLDRLPDLSLGNELLAGAIAYAHRRLAELRAALMSDVSAFAAALGVPAFVDAGGTVPGLLAAARAALDQVPPKLAANDFTGAATQLGLTLHAVSDATVAVGGATLVDLLGATPCMGRSRAQRADAAVWPGVAPRVDGGRNLVGVYAVRARPRAHTGALDAGLRSHRTAGPAAHGRCEPAALGRTRHDRHRGRLRRRDAGQPARRQRVGAGGRFVRSRHGARLDVRGRRRVARDPYPHARRSGPSTSASSRWSCRRACPAPSTSAPQSAAISAA
jgi:hypothetical protein